jgi:hypothetical protein
MQDQWETTAQLIEAVLTIAPTELSTTEQQNVWHAHAVARPSRAERLAALFAIYQKMTEATTVIWKAKTLCYISEYFFMDNCPWLSKYYAMLALCEESRQNPVNHTGASYRILLGMHGMSEFEIMRYAQLAHDNHQNAEFANLPEDVLIALDQDWKTSIPSPHEYGFYFTSRVYIDSILDRIHDLLTQEQETNTLTRHARGLALEKLARYAMGCMPGARINVTREYQQGTDTDYDVVCSLDGFHVDFRTELGRYFIGECKASQSATSYEVMAKFCRVLDEVKAKLGVLFALNGITGQNVGANAESEQLNVYRDRGIVIIVITEAHLRRVARGHNFINILRRKYDQVRLLKQVAFLPGLDDMPQ